MLMRRRDVTDLWPRDLAILEIDPRDERLANSLQALGYTNYLAAVADQSQLESIAEQNPQLGDRLAVYHSSKIVRQNNAAALVLNRGIARNFALFRRVRHAEFVAWEIRLTPARLLAMLVGLLQCLLGKLKFPTVVQIDTSGDKTPIGATRLMVFAVRTPRPHSKVRRFIPHRLQVDGFLRRLLAENIRHAVLRWFESLPQIEPGEDVDLLVDDEQLERVREILSSGVGIQPVDLYSMSGRAGSDYRGRPYFPPPAAEELLANAVVQRNLCCVPATREHFLSLAYHAIYHKGYDSGLADGTDSKPTGKNAEHNYHSVLTDLAKRLIVDMPITLGDLDQYLAEQCWQPPRETLQRLAEHNRWLQSHLKHRTTTAAPETAGAVKLARTDGKIVLRRAS